MDIRIEPSLESQSQPRAGIKSKPRQTMRTKTSGPVRNAVLSAKQKPEGQGLPSSPERSLKHKNTPRGKGKPGDKHQKQIAKGKDNTKGVFVKESALKQPHAERTFSSDPALLGSARLNGKKSESRYGHRDTGTWVCCVQDCV